MEKVILKNGSEEVKSLVAVTMLSLQNIANDNPIAWFELVEKCRNDKHEFFGNTRKHLEELALVQSNGSVHGSIKNIVLSSSEGEGLGLTLINPIK
jgi:hypothetical protein